MSKPNVLVILTDQLRHPPGYESEEVAEFRKANMPGVERLRKNGITFNRHYPMATACAPSRAFLLTGQYPSLHGVAQTDGLAKSADGGEVSWLDPDGVPTLGDWFRAGQYRTYYKGKWHATHSHLEADDGDGYLLSVDDEGNRQEENIRKYLEADLLDEFGFSEWVGPEPHGLGKHNMGQIKDPFTADETIELLERLDGEEDQDPWLAVCSFLNPHDISYFGVVGLTQGIRYHPSEVPHIDQAPTHEEDLSTKPACQKAYNENWSKMGAPQPWIQTHLRFYYETQARVDAEITRVLDALAGTSAFENTIVVFSSDHGDMLGAHGGMHEKWHVAYEEALRVPFVVSSPSLPAGERELEAPTSHADLIPTLLGLVGIDESEARVRLEESHSEVRPLVGRDLSSTIRGEEAVPVSEPVFFMTDDEISEGHSPGASPFQGLARKARIYSELPQPNHLETVVAEVEIEGGQHLVKLTRYHDNPQFWTVPDERDERLRGRKTITVTSPEPDEFELYDLTVDPYEERNLAHPDNADDHSRALQSRMLELLVSQLEEKRLTPRSGETPGYLPPGSSTAV